MLLAPRKTKTLDGTSNSDINPPNTVVIRKAMIYKANDKKSDNLLKDILEFCINYSFPKDFALIMVMNLKILN